MKEDIFIAIICLIGLVTSNFLYQYANGEDYMIAFERSFLQVMTLFVFLVAKGIKL